MITATKKKKKSVRRSKREINNPAVKRHLELEKIKSPQNAPRDAYTSRN
jgi:hypothetical protein